MDQVRFLTTHIGMIIHKVSGLKYKKRELFWSVEQEERMIGSQHMMVGFCVWG